MRRLNSLLGPFEEPRHSHHGCHVAHCRPLSGVRFPYVQWAYAILIVLFLTLPLPSIFAQTHPLKVGCFYFPGWFTADRWAPIVDYGGRTPILGYYNDASPLTQDWHIRQATNHGISFWIFDWYYDRQTDTVFRDNAALDEGFLHASLRNRMKFAIMWCNESSASPDYTHEQLFRMVRTIGSRYLDQGDYLKAPDGGNILVISRPDRLIQCFGVEGCKKELAAMNEEAKPWGGLIFVGIQSPSLANLTNLRNAGFDACTLYGYSTDGMKPGTHEAPYDTILPTVAPIWNTAARSGDLPVIPCVSPGWDSRAWYGANGVARTGSTPRNFQKMCETLKADANPKLNMILIGTWNEFGEGSYIEPTEQRGCAYLDAMQRAFFPSMKRFDHPKPTMNEKAKMDYPDIPAHLEKRIARQGGNLIINPGFERDWGWVCFDGSPATFETTVVHGGRRALLLTKAQEGVKTKMLEPGIPWRNRFNNHIRVEAGKNYRVSAWVYGKASIQAALFDKEERWLGRYQPIAQGGVDDKWSKLEGTLTVTDPSTAFFDLEITPLEAKVYVDDVGVWKL